MKQQKYKIELTHEEIKQILNTNKGLMDMLDNTMDSLIETNKQVLDIRQKMAQLIDVVNTLTSNQETIIRRNKLEYNTKKKDKLN